MRTVFRIAISTYVLKALMAIIDTTVITLSYAIKPGGPVAQT
ncbi:MAG: hypothetical protein ACE5GH_07510 [Fidelibacterota bacterium]